MIKIYGKNCTYEAIRVNKGVQKVFLLDSNSKKDVELVRVLNEKKIKYEVLSKDKLDRLFPNQNQGYGAYRDDYELCDESYINSLTKDSARVLLLDGIQDPHNLGAILRSVDAFGIDLVVLPKSKSCFLTEAVAHVSTGAIEHTKIMYVNSLLPIINRLKDNGFWICGTDAKGNVEANKIDKNLKLGIIIGSEGFGMSKTLVNASDYLITIPMVGHVNSLNASVSCAIVLHDLMKN